MFKRMIFSCLLVMFGKTTFAGLLTNSKEKLVLAILAREQPEES